MMASTSMSGSLTDKNYFNKEMAALKICGLNLTGKKESRSYKVYSFLVLAVANFGYPILDFGDVFKHDFAVVSQMLIYTFSSFAAFAKTAVMLRNRHIIGKMLRKLGQEPFLPNPERGGSQEEKLIKECLLITNAQTLTYWILGAICLLASNVYTLVKRLKSSDYHDWEFPYGPLTLVNVTYSPNFEFSWLYQSGSYLSIATHFSTIDLIIAAVLVHISYQFKVLQNNLQRLVKNSYKKIQKVNKKESNVSLNSPNLDNDKIDERSIAWIYLKISLKEVVNYHLAIMDIAEEMEEIFSSLLLLVFLGTLGMLCFSVYHISMMPLSGPMIIRHAADMGAVLMQILIVCYWGEQVAFESQNVGNAAYAARFVGTDLRFQKGLALIIQRSQKPTELTAGKFTTISLSTLTWILRTSYSAFMVLRNTDSPEI